MESWKLKEKRWGKGKKIWRKGKKILGEGKKELGVECNTLCYHGRVGWIFRWRNWKQWDPKCRIVVLIFVTWEYWYVEKIDVCSTYLRLIRKEMYVLVVQVVCNVT